MTVQEIVEAVSQLTVWELVELVRDFETRFGVSASPTIHITPTLTVPVDEPIEQTDFSVVIKSSGDKKVQIIKLIRELTGLTLREAKDLVDAAPKIVKDHLSRENAEIMKERLQADGAQVEIK